MGTSELQLGVKDLRSSPVSVSVQCPQGVQQLWIVVQQICHVLLSYAQHVARGLAPNVLSPLRLQKALQAHNVM